MNHSLLPGAPAEHVTLVPQPADDCDRLTVDDRGVYVVPPARHNLTVVIKCLEARAVEHEPGTYKHTFFSGYAAMHRARLADLSAPDPDEHRPEPDDEYAHVGYVTPQLGL